VRNPNTLYVETLPLAPPILYSAVGKRTNGGQVWSKVLDAPAISAIVVNPQDSAVIHAASERGRPSGGEGVFKSTHEGRTWINVLAHANISQRTALDLAVDLDHPSTLCTARAAASTLTDDKADRQEQRDGQGSMRPV